MQPGRLYLSAMLQRTLVGLSRTLRQQQVQLGGRAAAAAAQRYGFATGPTGSELAGSELEWDDELDEMVAEAGDDAKREMASFKSYFFELKNKYDQMSKPVEPIDWDSYKDTVDPELLAMFKHAFETLPRPEFPKDELEKARAAFHEAYNSPEALAEAEKDKKALEEIEVAMEEAKKELEHLEYVTIDECLAANPELAKEIDDEIAEGKWFLTAEEEAAKAKAKHDREIAAQEAKAREIADAKAKDVAAAAEGKA